MTCEVPFGRLALVGRDINPGRLTISLESGATPIAGRLITDDGETPFTGWIELAGLIEALHARCSTAADSKGDKQTAG